MAKYISNRQQNLKIGIVSYTEGKTVLEVTGKVGIGTTNATSKLWVDGDGYFVGVLSSTKFVGGSISGTSVVGTSLSISGISTLGIASATNLTSQQLNVSGISTLGVTSATNLTSQQLNVSGISTFTNGPVLIGGGTSTGTAGQVLQVTGINSSVYIGGSVGLGTTNPTSKLWIEGDGYFTGVVTATSFSGNASSASYATNAGYSTSSGISTNLKGGSGGTVVYQSAADTTAFLANGTSGHILQSNGGTNAPTWVAAAPAGAITGLTIRDEGNIVGDVNSASQLNFVGSIVSVASTAGIATITFLDYVSNAGISTFATNAGISTNLKGGVVGNIPYQFATDTTAFLTNGGSGTVLQSNGVGNAPSWVTAAPAGAITGLTIRDEGNIVGDANSFAQLNFVGSIVSVASSSGIATITFLDYVSNAGVSTSVIGGIASVTQLNVSGITTVGFITASSAYVSGIVTATSGFVGSLTGTATSTTNIPNLSGVITSNNTTTSLGSFTSLELLTALTDETGSGVAVFATSPTLVTPALGAATATSIVVGSGVTINASGINAASGIITASQLSTGASGTGINITTNTISGPATLTIDPAAVGDNTGVVRIKGDLYVDGDQFIVNSTTIELADFNVGIATTVGTNALLDGAGIGIGSIGIRKTIQWANGSSSLKSSESFNLNIGKTYKINGTDVLSNTTLGSGVTNSSLTSVGTLGQLNVTGVSTLGVTSTTNLTSQQLSVSRISTLGIT